MNLYPQRELNELSRVWALFSPHMHQSVEDTPAQLSRITFTLHTYATGEAKQTGAWETGREKKNKIEKWFERREGRGQANSPASKRITIHSYIRTRIHTITHIHTHTYFLSLFSDLFLSPCFLALSLTHETRAKSYATRLYNVCAV